MGAVRKKTRFLRSLSPTGLEEEESSETEDYLAIPREEGEEEESSETEDYLAIPREEEEEGESSETEDYLALPRGDLGPGGDHAVRKKNSISTFIITDRLRCL